MKKYIFVTLTICLFCLSVGAQKFGKPTRTPVPATPEQERIIKEGIRLHDDKKYDQAIELYLDVLEENPDCALALYELALSYYYKKDYEKTLETAYKLVQFEGNEGILGYGLFANALDDQGKPQDAIKIYQSGIKQLEGDPKYTDHLSSLYFNLGVTYSRQKKYNEARQALKKSVETNFQYASPNYLLAEIYYGTKYKIPAFLAAGRFVTMEINTNRTKRAVALVMEILKPAEKDDEGNINIFLDFNAPKDEGDFGAIDLLVGTLSAVKSDEDKKKTKQELFADSVSTLIAFLEEDKDLRKTFVGKNYIPFMSELKKRGYVKHFAYLILQQNGDQEAEKWLLANGDKSMEFFEWAKNYKRK
jgi:tetratricopeptide (TPR) repeat protein